MSDVLSIQNKVGKLRSRPSFLSRVSHRLPYGSKVTKLQEKSTWIQVQAGSLSGWLHKDAVTDKEIVISTDSEDVKRAASDDELVLAGKGFNENVEKGYRQRNPRVNFAPVDKMETFSVPEEELAEFVKRGGLKHG